MVGYLGYFLGVQAGYIGDEVDPWLTQPLNQASYVVGEYNSTHYYGQNSTGYGTSGNEGYEFLSTDASYVIQSAFDATSSGESIFITASNYEISSTINIDHSGVTIKGESRDWGTQLINTMANGYIFNISSATGNRVEYCTIENLMLRSSSRTANRHGINIFGVRLLKLRNLYFRNLDNGITVDGSTTDRHNRGGCVFSFIDMENMVGCGINFTGTVCTPEFDMYGIRIWAEDYDSDPDYGIIADEVLGTWVNVEIDYTNKSAIDLTNPYQVSLMSPWVEYAGKYGIYLHGSLGKYNKIEGGLVQNSQYHGIYLVDIQKTEITSVHLRNNGKAGAYDGIRLANTTNNILTAIHAYDDAGSRTQDWGIKESGTADYNIITSCNTKYNEVSGIWKEGSNTKVNLCWNSSSWIA